MCNQTVYASFHVLYIGQHQLRETLFQATISGRPKFLQIRFAQQIHQRPQFLQLCIQLVVRSESAKRQERRQRNGQLGFVIGILVQIGTDAEQFFCFFLRFKETNEIVNQKNVPLSFQSMCVTLLGCTWMLSALPMLSTLRRNGKRFAPPISVGSRATTVARDSPVDLTTDGPLTWSPIHHSAYGWAASIGVADEFSLARFATSESLPTFPHSYDLMFGISSILF